MASTTSRTVSARPWAWHLNLDDIVLQLSQHWLLVFNILGLLYVGLPWLAPIFMKIGWAQAGNLIYLAYSTQCHQLPERSFFLFGSKGMYSLAEIQSVWQNTTNPLILRQFIGNSAFGWKVAWSDRMVSMYGGVVLGGLIFSLVRRWLKPLPIWGFILFCVPMALDGGTHMISDLAGIGAGFRDTNLWLATLTSNGLPTWFYAGDALGSFNSWMRLLTGLIFGLGAAWLALPYLEEAMRELHTSILDKLQGLGASGSR